MASKELKATLALASAALLLGRRAQRAADGQARSLALLGPPDAPVKPLLRGRGKGPPVLLIHGWCEHLHLAACRARARRDPSGHRRRPQGFRPVRQAVRRALFGIDQAELLAQLIEDKDLRDLTIVGHSFGGGVALRLALDANARLEGRISRLVLLDSIAYPAADSGVLPPARRASRSQVGVRMVPPSVQTRVALQDRPITTTARSIPRKSDYAAPLKTAAGKHAIVQSARQIVPPDIETLPDRFKTITLPTLILWCDHDRIVPLEIGIKLSGHCPNSVAAGRGARLHA